MTQQLNERFQLNFKEQPNTITLRRESHDASYACDDKGKLIALNIRNQESLKEVVIPKEWTTLEYLNLSDDKDLKTLEFSTSLPDLFHIDLSDSSLEKVAIPNGFDALKNLDISRNGLKNIDFQGDLPALEMLDLSGNELVEVKLPHSVPALKYLYLNKNRISHLDFEAIPQLEVLHLRNNNLTALPANFIRLRNNLQTLYLHGNSLEDIPETILGHGENHNSCEDVVNYCYSEYKSVLQPLYQAKMVLIGNGEVGKTSIRLRLLDEKAPLPKKEERTPGLEIETYTIKNLEPKITQLPTPIDFDFHIWDFGGQGHYREVQQLFCGSKTLYLFVTSHDDTREIEQKEDYVGFEYWMSMVNAYSYDDNDDWVSPVIFVVNKIDQAPKAVNQADCQNLFKNVVEFVSISAETLENFDLLKNKIRSILPKVNNRIFTDKFSQFWLNVKSDLEKKRYRNHITFKQYLKICERNELVESEARSWIRVLDRIGTVIYFGENPKLRDWIILNPIWLKDVIYQVLDSPFVKRGILAASDFQHIWKDKTQEEQTHITALMEAYRLCYPTTDKFGEIQYVIPTLLSKKQPNLPADLQQPDFEIKLIFDPFLPAGTVNKLMVSLHDAIYNELRWKNHFILEDRQSQSYAHIWEDWENKTVFIALFGKNVQSLFQKVIGEMQQINDALKDTRFMNKLGFYIFAKKGTTWRALEALKEDGVEQFSFLWGKANDYRTTPKTQINMKQVKKLIAKGRIDQAFKALENKGDEDAQTMLTLLQGRWNGLKSKENMGIISSSDAGIERNRILMSLLSIAAEISEGETPPPPVVIPVSPEPPTSNNNEKGETYISYAWSDESTAIVDKIDAELAKKEITLQRDLKNIGYKDNIKAFMEALGKSNQVIVVISKKYLESDNCMFELTQIYENKDFAKRIFPIILNDANIYDPIGQIGYIKYWEDKTTKLDEAIKSIGRATDITALQEALNNYAKNKRLFSEIAAILKNLNALNPEIHQNENFESLYKALTNG